MSSRDVEENGWEGDEWGDEDRDDADEESESTKPCPYCRRAIHEDSQRCPHCEQYISEEDAPPSRKAWWIVAGAIRGLYAVYRWILG